MEKEKGVQPFDPLIAKAREQAARPVEGKVGAGVVALAVVVAIGIFLSAVDLKKFEWSWIAALVITLFAIALVGFIALAYGARGGTVTSEDTDKKIRTAWVAFNNAVKWPLLVGFLLWLSYLVWQVHLELKLP